MIQLKDIVKRLQDVLPKYTDSFSTNIPITSLINSGSIVTATTSQIHNLQTNQCVFITGAKTPYLIQTLFRYNNIAVAITQNYNNALGDTLEIIGANEIDYNGLKEKSLYPEYEIEGITTIGGVATITTIEEHNIIFNSKIEIEISGVKQEQYNKVVKITGVPTNKTITFDLKLIISNAEQSLNKIMKFKIKENHYSIAFKVENNPTTPATGTIYNLISNNQGYNGLKTILSTPTDDSFTYSIDGIPESPAQGTINASYNLRFTAAATIEKGIEFFKTQQEENWIIAVATDEITSRDKNISNDADVQLNNGNTGFQNLYTNINFYALVPCGINNNNENIQGRYARDFCELLKPIIHKAIAGYKFPIEFSSQETYTPAILTNSGTEIYTNGIYIHRYSFMITGKVYNSDYCDDSDISRLLNVKLNILNKNLENIETKVDINYLI